MKYKILIIFIIGGLLISGCQKKEAAKQEGPQIIPVKVSSVELKDIYKTLEYVGDIKALEEVMVYPKVGGKILEKIKQEGSEVKKGETVFYIDRDEIGLKFEKAPVESPIDGVVGRIYVDTGDNVTNQTSLALIVSMDNVKIDLDIPEKYISNISLGQKADIYVDAYPGKVFSGSITRLIPVLDTQTRSMPVEITAENIQHLLKSGMFARVSLIIGEEKAAPLLLKESIMGKGDDTYVYVVKDNKAMLRKVKLGIKQNEYFQAKEGIDKGELVVTMGQQRLRDGSMVKIEQ